MITNQYNDDLAWFEVDPVECARFVKFVKPLMQLKHAGKIPFAALPGSMAMRWQPVRVAKRAMRETFADDWPAVRTMNWVIQEYPVGVGFRKHRDDLSGGTAELRRTLSCSIHLTAGYSGGDLLLWPDGPRTEPVIQDAEVGAGVCFRANVLHEVLPVTRGRRLSLIGWAWSDRSLIDGRGRVA